MQGYFPPPPKQSPPAPSTTPAYVGPPIPPSPPSIEEALQAGQSRADIATARATRWRCTFELALAAVDAIAAVIAASPPEETDPTLSLGPAARAAMGWQPRPTRSRLQAIEDLVREEVPRYQRRGVAEPPAKQRRGAAEPPAKQKGSV